MYFVISRFFNNENNIYLHDQTQKLNFMLDLHQTPCGSANHVQIHRYPYGHNNQRFCI
ncbi:hypothetical protein HanXRQr2_Chr14g0650391 [Helianthus annuus]|uniref:Uncharacterized protein n=1 Tax=Helianthus annuus TaxID=4232 RepID=A0A9K3E9D4_HELAN|nr:hypothetical protein HanXRQr2_Chr14g0650391 [Helianthus annuus]KAJ0840861.1 hypothetical protein HanPSC8_Chr14g0623831 [Helianthus annuus]